MASYSPKLKEQVLKKLMPFSDQGVMKVSCDAVIRAIVNLVCLEK